MSEMEHHIGKAIKLVMPQDKEEWAINTLVEEKMERDDYYDTAWEQIINESDKYVFVKEQLWFLDDKEVEDDVCQGYIQEDGSIEYVANWYNGGAGFKEVIEAIIEDAK